MKLSSSFLLIALVFVSGCASRPPAQAKGELTLVSLAPKPGSLIGEKTVLEAILDYSLENMNPSATYAIMPMFGDKRGEGYSFNAPRSGSRPVLVTAAKGRVEIRYPIRGELMSPRLARPVKMWFNLIETEARRGRTIATIGPFEFQ